MAGYGNFVQLAVRRYGVAPRRRRVGDVIGIIWPYVSVSEIEALDAKILNLHSDIIRLRIEPPPPDAPPEEVGDYANAQRRLAGFWWEWTQFRARWTAWKDDHYGEVSRTGDEIRQEFDGMRLAYNEYLRRFKAEWGGQTAAAPAESEAGKESPVEKGLTALTWASLAVLAGVGVYIYRQAKQ